MVEVEKIIFGVRLEKAQNNSFVMTAIKVLFRDQVTILLWQEKSVSVAASNRCIRRLLMAINTRCSWFITLVW